MKIVWSLASLALSPPPASVVVQNQPILVQPSSSLHEATSVWLSTAQPSADDVALLRKAFAAFYGTDRNLDESEKLLSQAIDIWQSQPPDELAGLYRVRGDCYVLRADASKAASDYGKAIELIEGPGGSAADLAELPAAYLGRARALKSQLLGASPDAKIAQQAASDYRKGLVLNGRQDDWDTEQELLEDGIRRNPYAAWEWGATLASAKDWKLAGAVQQQASDAFDDIGDKAHAVMALLDAGIAKAAAADDDKAIALLQRAIPMTNGVESRDYELLQRLVSKEGEGRMALAALLWNKGERSQAEESLGTACLRLDQLQEADRLRANSRIEEPKAPKLLFSIDDMPTKPLVDCSDFKKASFLSSRLGWPETLQKKMVKLEKLQTS